MNSRIGRYGILFVVVSYSLAAMLGDHVLAAWIRLRRSIGSRHSLSLSSDVPSQMLRRFQLAFRENLVDDYLRRLPPRWSSVVLTNESGIRGAQ